VSLRHALTEHGAIITPFVSAIRLNAAAAVRVWRWGHQGWTGAVNTDYNPLDRVTAAPSIDTAAHRHHSPSTPPPAICPRVATAKH
jgi:hypothetical protein